VRPSLGLDTDRLIFKTECLFIEQGVSKSLTALTIATLRREPGPDRAVQAHMRNKFTKGSKDYGGFRKACLQFVIAGASMVEFVLY
jgi:hypothetical protein